MSTCDFCGAEVGQAATHCCEASPWLWGNGIDYVCARSEAEARTVLMAGVGYDSEDADGPDGWSRWDKPTIKWSDDDFRTFREVPIKELIGDGTPRVLGIAEGEG